MQTKSDVAWLTIRVTAPTARSLNSTLTAIVKRAHARGLKAATIAHPTGELPLQTPRPSPRQISLPDGVTGTVTVADDATVLREFVVQIRDLIGVHDAVQIDGAPFEFQRQTIGS